MNDTVDYTLVTSALALVGYKRIVIGTQVVWARSEEEFTMWLHATARFNTFWSRLYGVPVHLGLRPIITPIQEVGPNDIIITPQN